MPKRRFQNPVNESWEEDSETVIYGDDLLEEVSHAEAVRAAMRRPSVPPAPLPATRRPRLSSRKDTQRRAPHRQEMPTPVMTIQPGPAAFRPESRPPPFSNEEALSALSIPRPPRVPQNIGAPSPADRTPPERRATSRSPAAVRSEQSNLDTLRPYVGTLTPASHAHRQQPFLFDVSHFSTKHIAAWGLGLVVVLFAVMAFDREPQVNATQSQEIPACNLIMLDGDAIEPIKQPSLVERVRAFDQEALDELKSREPMSLSTEEVEALAMGLEQRARENTAQIVGDMAKKPQLTAADEAIFLRHAGSLQAYREAFFQMAQNESWQGPDLIYAAMRRYKSQQEISDFAHALLVTHRIYKYASPALRVVIDAETLTECEDIRDLVERAHEDSDKRAVSHLVKFAKKTGCGAGGKEDCYPCLRENTHALTDALRAAQGRMPPAF